MKKLYLLASAALCAMTMNAQLYVVGNGTGMTWDLPGQMISANDDGSYTLNLSACDQFKVSRNNSTAWDGDGSFNAGTIAPIGNAFSDAVFNQGGETLSTNINGENISLPANGRYTITISADFSKMTAVANFAKPTVAPAVYIRGGMNGWGSPDAWKFNYNSSTDSYTLDCTINAGVEFKIADSTWGNINYTCTTAIALDGSQNALIYNNPANMKLTSDFSGTVEFKILAARNSATVTFTPAGSGPVYPENMYVIGTIDGNAWDPNNVAQMSNNGEGIYVIESVKLGENGGSCGFALTANYGTWDDVNSLRFGPAVTDTKAVLGLNTVDGIGDLSWTFSAGTYKMTFDYTAKTLLIENAGDIIDPNPNPGEDTDAIYVVGNGDGMTWDLPGTKYTKNEDGNFVLNLSNVSSFKFSTISATEWDGDNGFNAHAYATGSTTFGDDVNLEGGQTLPLIAWGENQELPWSADYTITIKGDMTEITAYTATPRPTGAPTVYIRGDMTDDWAALPKWQLTYNEADDNYTFECKGETMLPAGQKFKFADSNWGAVNYGSGNLQIELDTLGLDEVMTKGGNDMAMLEDFEGRIIFVIDANSAVATFISYNESGVESLVGENGPATYYNLQGQKVANPERGIYIKVVDGKAVKVVK